MTRGRTDTAGHQRSIDEIIDVMDMLQRPYWAVYDGWTAGRSNTYKHRNNEIDDMEASKAALVEYLELIGRNGGKFRIGFSEKADSNNYSSYKLHLLKNDTHSGSSAISGVPYGGYVSTLGSISGSNGIDGLLEKARREEREKVLTEVRIEALEEQVNNPSTENKFMQVINGIPDQYIPLITNVATALMSKLAIGTLGTIGNTATIPHNTSVSDIDAQMAALAKQKEDLMNAPNDNEVLLSDDADIDDCLVRISEHFELVTFMKKLANWIDSNPAMAKQMFDNA